MIGTANAASLSPQVEGQNLNGRTVEEAFGGVVVGQTVSVAAQDFMQYFVAMWRDKPHNERYTIVIHERPSARWGNLLWIEYQREKIFQTVLPFAWAHKVDQRASCRHCMARADRDHTATSH